MPVGGPGPLLKLKLMKVLLVGENAVMENRNNKGTISLWAKLLTPKSLPDYIFNAIGQAGQANRFYIQRYPGEGEARTHNYCVFANSKRALCSTQASPVCVALRTPSPCPP